MADRVRPLVVADEKRPAAGWPVPADDEARTLASPPHTVVADRGHVVPLKR
ncbi:hypothetical protein GCM10010492_14230 [Saccharothrix mutabilis subsp. mutabilis]|uniref:Uncharacterized protein n=1 Tax=Saccharothrix mutabilis subsp. mutabilis TaxID=66855 RepID=A0ABP3CXQ7_9PSEU